MSGLEWFESFFWCLFKKGGIIMKLEKYLKDAGIEVPAEEPRKKGLMEKLLSTTDEDGREIPWEIEESEFGGIIFVTYNPYDASYLIKEFFDTPNGFIATRTALISWHLDTRDPEERGENEFNDSYIRIWQKE